MMDVKAIRLKLGLTQEELAYKLGDNSPVGKWQKRAVQTCPKGYRKFDKSRKNKMSQEVMLEILKKTFDDVEARNEFLLGVVEKGSAALEGLDLTGRRKQPS